MRVLHLTVSAAHGGRRDAILTLIDHLRPLGAECGFVALRNTAEEVAQFALQLDYFDGLQLATRPTLTELAHIARLCRAWKTDIVHAHDAASHYVAAMLRLVSPKLRVVMTFHRTLGVDSEGLQNRLRNALLLPLVHRVVTASEERRAYFRSKTTIPAAKVAVIPYGIDLTRYHPDRGQRDAVRAELGLAPETALIVAIGHFGPEKGLDQVLAGAALAAAGLAGVRWHLVILGSGSADQTAALGELSGRLLGDRATWVGFRTDVPRWLQAADLLIHAPRMEAFGLVVIQGMACGLPVVATAVGGLPEIVADGVTGRLVAAGDIAGFGAAIAALLTDPTARCRMGAAALARARDRYDARLMAARHLALYRAILGRRPAALPTTP